MSLNTNALRSLAPHINLHRGRLIVLKIGGELLEPGSGLEALLEQLSLLYSIGIRLLIVHGGAPQIAALCQRLDLPVEMVNGRRVTSPQVLEVVSMILPGALQSSLLARMRRHGLPAVGVNGASSAVLNARRRRPIEQLVNGSTVQVDYGAAGELQASSPDALCCLLDAGFIPVVAPLASNTQGELLNVNADTVASWLAQALVAHKLIFLTQPPGILSEPPNETSLISELTISQLAQLEADGTLTAGMLPKAAAARAALAGGVARVHFVSGHKPDALLQELLTNEGSGTMVTGDV